MTDTPSQNCSSAMKQKTDNTPKSMPPVHRRGHGGRFMGSPIEKPANLTGTLKRLDHYLKQDRRLFLFLLMAVLLVTLCGLAIPAIQGKTIDTLFSPDTSSLIALLPLLLVLYLASALANLAQSRLSADLGQNIVRRMRNHLFTKFSRLPISYLDNHERGNLMSIMTYDVENISSSVSQSFGLFISGLLTLVGTMAIMLLLCWQLALTTMATVILTAVVTVVLSKVMRKAFKAKSVALGALNGYAEEMITGYRTITAYNRQQTVVDDFNGFSERLRQAGFKAGILGGSMGPIMGIISNLSFIIVAVCGGWLVLQDVISLGTIAAFVIYVKQFTRPVNELAQLYGTLQTAVASAERVFAVFDQPDEDNSGSLKPENLSGEVSFQHVTFAYVPDKQVLQDVNLTIHPGEKIALVGATGSGKTTVVNLLMRFYQPTSGKILIDGQDILTLDRDWLRHNVAIVLQDTVLFSDTIARNITYADQQASPEDMRNAATLSKAAPFIELLPESYQTQLNHAGESLSQGERQLLTIARAVLADPKILILDEATSNVDTRTEKNIQEAMANLMKNRTSLVIAHRLSTIRDADKIVVMDDGHIVEMGSHEELLQQQGKYHALYMQQFSGQAI